MLINVLLGCSWAIKLMGLAPNVGYDSLCAYTGLYFLVAIVITKLNDRLS